MPVVTRSMAVRQATTFKKAPTKQQSERKKTDETKKKVVQFESGEGEESPASKKVRNTKQKPPEKSKVVSKAKSKGGKRGRPKKNAAVTAPVAVEDNLDENDPPGGQIDECPQQPDPSSSQEAAVSSTVMEQDSYPMLEEVPQDSAPIPESVNADDVKLEVSGTFDEINMPDQIPPYSPPSIQQNPPDYDSDSSNASSLFLPVTIDRNTHEETSIESRRRKKSIPLNGSGHPRVSTAPVLSNIPEEEASDSDSSQHSFGSDETVLVTPTRPKQQQPPASTSTNPFKTPVAQKTTFFVKPGSTSVRKSILKPHEEIVQKPTTPFWKPPPATSAAAAATSVKTPHLKHLRGTYAINNEMETPKSHYTLVTLRNPEGSASKSMKRVSFKTMTEVSDGDSFPIDEEAGQQLLNNTSITSTPPRTSTWTVPRKATPVTDVFKQRRNRSGSRHTPKEVSIAEINTRSEDTEISIGSCSSGKKSSWVPARCPTPGKPSPISSSDDAEASACRDQRPMTPTLRNSRKTISRRLTYSLENEKIPVKVKEEDESAESSVGYNITEYEGEIGSSEEAYAEKEYRKNQRRAAKKKTIPKWAQGKQLKMGLVKMLPLADPNSTYKAFFFPRIFPRMREPNNQGDDKNATPFSLFPSVGVANQSSVVSEEVEVREVIELPSEKHEDDGSIPK